jgi:hypothetical protein
MNNNLATLCLSFAVLATAPLAYAGIINPSFESPGGAGFPQASNWTGEALTALHASFGPGTFPGGGDRFAFSQPKNPPATQSLSDTFAASTTYTFQAYAVDNADKNDMRFTIGYDDGGFVELEGVTYDLESIDTWTLMDGVSYTTGSTGAELGKNIIVRVGTVDTGAGPGAAAWFDAVSLTTVQVPEPTSILLFALATGIGLGARRLR